MLDKYTLGNLITIASKENDNIQIANKFLSLIRSYNG